MLVSDNPGGEDCIDEEAATTTNKRLQRMKVQSRKTFKFRKTRKREREVVSLVHSKVLSVLCCYRTTHQSLQ